MPSVYEIVTEKIITAVSRDILHFCVRVVVLGG
jgi:hypothetical protein